MRQIEAWLRPQPTEVGRPRSAACVQVLILFTLEAVPPIYYGFVWFFCPVRFSTVFLFNLYFDLVLFPIFYICLDGSFFFSVFFDLVVFYFYSFLIFVLLLII